eukprot:202915_1
MDFRLVGSLYYHIHDHQSMSNEYTSWNSTLLSTDPFNIIYNQFTQINNKIFVITSNAIWTFNLSIENNEKILLTEIPLPFNLTEYHWDSPPLCATNNETHLFLHAQWNIYIYEIETSYWSYSLEI